MPLDLGNVVRKNSMLVAWTASSCEGTVCHPSLAPLRTSFTLDTILSGGRPSDHPLSREDGNVIWLTVRPDLLFLDIRDSVRAAHLEHSTLTYLNQRSNFDKQSRKASLDNLNRPFTP
jgi:hypothetical protein